MKGRSATQHHFYDTVRGAGVSKSLQSNNTNAEGSALDNATYGYLSAHTSDGFSVNAGSSPTYLNVNNINYVTWAWDAGSSTVSNTDGSLTSSVRANPAAGFSIVTWTGNGTNGATVGHGLNVTPGMVIVKSRSNAYEWPVYHSGLTAGNNLFLHLTNSQNSVSGTISAGGIGAVSSTTFTCTQGISNINNTNATSATYVAYCFAPVEGYSAIGTYSANALDNGPFVYTGFRPKWIMIKHATGTASSYSSWIILDTERDTYNVSDASLLANRTSAEGTRGDGSGTAGPWMDILSNGFKIRYSWQVVNGTSGDKYLYMAFAENPLSLNGGLAR